MLRLLFNAAILGFLALLLLPSIMPTGNEAAEQTASQPAQADIGANLMRLAGAISTDLGSVCQRQPAICENGAALAAASLARAQEGWKIAAGLLKPAGSTPAEATPADAVQTGGI